MTLAQTSQAPQAPDPIQVSGNATFMRGFGWINLAALAALLLNNVLVMGGGFSGPLELGSGLANSYPFWGLMLLAVVVACLYVSRTPSIGLRQDAHRINIANRYLIRACFFAVFLVGLFDSVIAFMRVEDLLTPLLGEDTAKNFSRSYFVGQYVHFPLVALGFLVAAVTRGLGFAWLAFLIVLAELAIVISRFVFSYEQALMGDLVRYWYAALFLFASAHTLLDDSHVRVDVLYAGFRDRKKGVVNGLGTILLAMTTCWTIIVIGFGHARAIINGPIANFEISQTGSAGLFIKYQMAALLGVFGVTMLIQFVSFLFEAFADYRGDPGKRETAQAAH
ncbi:TRAP transporter small permease subunit [Epibacterium ulvae]|uniref:TRAP transporter small permease subunit n=1 Tax=Epibacterium ulvae TaxID=1156985 RepID=UPI001BFCD1BE|nr:TRAP transporter small permease subunit [Epibacterium ulvae]MBT8153907.1 TRAP transporter small permease subunit [Epibacterium ulvae]